MIKKVSISSDKRCSLGKTINTVHEISKDEAFIIISLVQATVEFFKLSTYISPEVFFRYIVNKYMYLFSKVHTFVANLLCFAGMPQNVRIYVA